MAAHSSILAWKITCAGLVDYCPVGRKWAAPGRLLSMGLQRVDTTERREEERLNNSKVSLVPWTLFWEVDFKLQCVAFRF